MSAGAIGGTGMNFSYSGANAGGKTAAPAGESVAGVMKDAAALESQMALQLLQAGAQTAAVAQQMEFTQQIVDMYV